MANVIVVDAVVLLIEDIFHTHAWHHIEPLRHVEGVGGVDAPNAISWSVLIVGIECFALQASVQIHIQGVAIPSLIVVERQGASMAH